MSLEKLKIEIQGLMLDSLAASVRVGQLLNSHNELVADKGEFEFYQSVGLSARAAQRYMQVAKSTKVRVHFEENILESPSGFIPKDNFDYEHCRKLSEFKVEYKVLVDRVKELQELLELKVA